LQAANSAVGQAFNSVLEAEKAGGNITQLLAKLNTAGELLAEAQNIYNSDSRGNVLSIVENAIQIANQVNSDAVTLSGNSLIESQNNIKFTLIFSIFGATIFTLSLVLIWRRFRHSHVMKVLGRKPEVVENTT
jgi:thiamine monophosphate synthase